MSGLIAKLNDGGPAFTYTILILMLVIIGLLIKAFTEKEENPLTTSLIKHLAWFAVAWGFLGRTFGLIVAFDNVAAAGELTPSLLAEGLKMAILDPLMGISAFLIARGGLILLTLLRQRT